MKRKIIKEDLDTEEINLKISPRYEKVIDPVIIKKITSILNHKYGITPNQIISSNDSIIIKRLPLEFYVDVDKDVRQLSNQLTTKMIGHYSDGNKYYDADKQAYSDEPKKQRQVGKHVTVIESGSRMNQKVKTGKIKVLDCDLRIDEDTYEEYMEEDLIEEGYGVDDMGNSYYEAEPQSPEDFDSWSTFTDWRNAPNIMGISVTKNNEDPGSFYESYEYCDELELGEDNENKTYLDKVNDEAHDEPYEKWTELTDDEDPDDILLTEADLNSSESKGKQYRFIGEPVFMNQYLCSKLDGYNINYNAVYEDTDDGDKLLEVDVYQDDLKGTGVTIKDLDDWLEDRSLGDWQLYQSVSEVNEVNDDEIDFRGRNGESENALEGPLTDTYMFLDEELSYDFDFLDDSALIRNPLLLDEAINQPEYKFYVVSLSQNKIVSGWEFRSDANDYVREMEDSLGVLKIFQAAKLKQAGLDPNNDKSWGTEKFLNETTTASIAVPDMPALTTTLKTKMIDPVKQTKLSEAVSKNFNDPKFWIGKTLTLDLKTWEPNMPEEGSYNEEDIEEIHWYMNEEEWNKFYSLLKKGSKAKVINVYDEGSYDNESNKPSNDAQSIEGFKWSLQFVEAPELDIDPAGNGIGFDTYPREIEHFLGYNRDYYFRKIKVYTKGKNIKENQMKNKEQLIKETLENLHKEVLKEETFEPSKVPNLANSLNNSYKKADKENSESKFDPYKNASNVIKGSKTEIKKRNSILEGEYRIKNHNIKDKGLEKFTVIVENSNFQKEAVAFEKKDFAKYIFENCNTKKYIKEGKFDYFSYIGSRPYSFVNSLLESYFDSKIRKQSK